MSITISGVGHGHLTCLGPHPVAARTRIARARADQAAVRGLLEGVGDPADGAAEQEHRQRGILRQAEHALDRHGGEIDVGLAVDQPLARVGEPLGEGEFRRASGMISRSIANSVAARTSPSG